MCYAKIAIEEIYRLWEVKSTVNVAVILAGGVGNRMGADVPKQYIEINGKPIIAYTLEKFEKTDSVEAIEIVCAEEYIEYNWEIARKFNYKKVKWVCKGGKTCQDSIRNGVYNLRDKVADDDIVVIHMSISPLVSEETVNSTILKAKEKGNAFAVLPCLFCMCKKINDEWSDQNAYKEDYLEVNMPWTMKFGELCDLYMLADKDDQGKAERDYLPSLMYTYGRKTYFVRDNDANRLKITTKDDLKLFRAYLNLEQERGE